MDFSSFSSDDLNILEGLLSYNITAQRIQIDALMKTRENMKEIIKEQTKSNLHKLVMSQISYWDNVMTMLALIEEERRKRMSGK